MADQRREPGEKSFGVDLEEHLRLAQAGQRTATEAPESDPSRHRARHRGLRFPGDDDLPAVGDRAHARHGVDRQTDVPGVGQRRAAAVDAGAHPDVDIVRPDPFPQGALDVDCGLDRRGGMLEDREVLVPVGVDLVSAAPTHRVADDAPDVVQQGCVALAQTCEQEGGTLDIGQEERDHAGRERREVGRPVAAL